MQRDGTVEHTARTGRGGMRAVAAALAFLALAIAGAAPAAAAGGPGVGPVTSLPMPRYVSLNASEINVRRGPGLEYRRDWLFKRRGLPVRIVDEYGHWRRIEDHEGAGGWVYHALVSGRRTVLVTAEGVLLRERPVGPPGIGPCAEHPGLPDNALACAERGVVARVTACRSHWCAVVADGIEGWVPKEAIWGVEPAEEFGN